MITVKVQECKCPTCGAQETHPADKNKPVFERRILIKGFKVELGDGYWWSHCLVCAGYYDKDLNETPENFDRSKGWF